MTGFWRTARRTLVLVLGAALFGPKSARAEDAASTCADAANLGQPLRRAGRLREAREQFLICARDECPEAIRKRCVPWGREVDAAVPTVVVRARDADGVDIAVARVEIDGAPIASANADGIAGPIDPGPHHVRVQTLDGAVNETDVLVAQGEKNRLLVVTFARGAIAVGVGPVDPPFVPARVPLVPAPLAFGIGAIGIVGLAASVFFEVKAHSDDDSLASGCATTRTCATSDLDSVRRSSVLGIAAGSVGLAAVGASVFLLLWRTTKGAPVPAVALAPPSLRF